MPKTTQKISSYHKWVLALGAPFVLIAPFLYLYYGHQAIFPTEVSGRNRRSRELFWNVVNGTNVRDLEPLPLAQFYLAAWIIGTVVTLALVIVPALVAERRTPKLDLRAALTLRNDHAVAASVGDDLAWTDPAGEPAKGAIVEIHHGPFAVGPTSVYASYQRPGYTVRRADGSLLGIGSDLHEKP